MRIPTPFAVGRVNTYLLEDDPLTLVDSGPNSGKALDELERQLDSLGHGLEEIELILVTHQHIDHMGLAASSAGGSEEPDAGGKTYAPPAPGQGTRDNLRGACFRQIPAARATRNRPELRQE
jgi:glyoxylase-like metal-dependent hydrolase (beta-lactamase superfamily II)